MVAYGWAMQNMQTGDEIVLSVMEHHANIVPWHFLRERMGGVIKWGWMWTAQGRLIRRLFWMRSVPRQNWWL